MSSVPSRVEVVARWAYQFLVAERWKIPVARPRAWESLVAESRQFWLNEAERVLSSITPAAAPPILNGEVGKVMFCRCAACHTVFPAIHLPASPQQFQEAAEALRCPYCGHDKTFVTTHPLSTPGQPQRLPTRPEGA